MTFTWRGRRVLVCDCEKTMPLDAMTKRNLELEQPLRPDSPGGTLLEVIDRTVTPMGRRLLRQWLLAPLNSAEQVNERLDAGRKRKLFLLEGIGKVGEAVCMLTRVSWTLGGQPKNLGLRRWNHKRRRFGELPRQC